MDEHSPVGDGGRGGPLPSIGSGKYTLQKRSYIAELNGWDVLLGRGSGPNVHDGNIRFRNHVSTRKDEYMNTKHRNNKSKIAKEVVQWVFKNNGRFVKKLELEEAQELGLIPLSSTSNGTQNEEQQQISFGSTGDGGGVDALNGTATSFPSFYELVDDETIMEKAKQSLRQLEKVRVRAGGGIGGTGGGSSSNADDYSSAVAAISSSSINEDVSGLDHFGRGGGTVESINDIDAVTEQNNNNNEQHYSTLFGNNTQCKTSPENRAVRSMSYIQQGFNEHTIQRSMQPSEVPSSSFLMPSTMSRHQTDDFIMSSSQQQHQQQHARRMTAPPASIQQNLLIVQQQMDVFSEDFEDDDDDDTNVVLEHRLGMVPQNHQQSQHRQQQHQHQHQHHRQHQYHQPQQRLFPSQDVDEVHRRLSEEAIPFHATSGGNAIESWTSFALHNIKGKSDSNNNSTVKSLGAGTSNKWMESLEVRQQPQQQQNHASGSNSFGNTTPHHQLYTQQTHLQQQLVLQQPMLSESGGGSQSNEMFAVAQQLALLQQTTRQQHQEQQQPDNNALSPSNKNDYHHLHLIQNHLQNQNQQKNLPSGLHGEVNSFTLFGGKGNQGMNDNDFLLSSSLDQQRQLQQSTLQIDDIALLSYIQNYKNLTSEQQQIVLMHVEIVLAKQREQQTHRSVASTATTNITDLQHLSGTTSTATLQQHNTKQLITAQQFLESNEQQLQMHPSLRTFPSETNNPLMAYLQQSVDTGNAVSQKQPQGSELMNYQDPMTGRSDDVCARSIMGIDQNSQTQRQQEFYPQQHPEGIGLPNNSNSNPTKSQLPKHEHFPNQQQHLTRESKGDMLAYVSGLDAEKSNKPRQQDACEVPVRAEPSSSMNASVRRVSLNNRRSVASYRRGSVTSRRGSVTSRRSSIQSVSMDDLNIDRPTRRPSSANNHSNYLVEDLLDTFSYMSTDNHSKYGAQREHIEQYRRMSMQTMETIGTIEQHDNMDDISFASLESSMFSGQEGSDNIDDNAVTNLPMLGLYNKERGNRGSRGPAGLSVVAAAAAAATAYLVKEVDNDDDDEDDQNHPPTRRFSDLDDGLEPYSRRSSALTEASSLGGLENGDNSHATGLTSTMDDHINEFIASVQQEVAAEMLLRTNNNNSN